MQLSSLNQGRMNYRIPSELRAGPGQFLTGLRDDDSLLRQVFFSILRHHHPNLAAKVDVIYALSQAWCTSQSDSDFELLVKYVTDLKPEERILVASSFSHMLNLHNLTEEVNSSQIGRAVRLGEMDSPTRDTNHSLLKLTAVNGLTPQQVYDTLCNQTVELVLTAHPTQALRASLLKKYAIVRRELDTLHSKRMSEYEKIETLEAIRAAVQAAWRTDEIRRSKPTPQDEMRSGLSYFSTVLFDVVPVFHRRVDTALEKMGLPRLPLDKALFKFGSWMGGDRDGNPNVTAETTRDVVVLARLETVNAYFRQVESLMFDLSIWRCSSELKELAERIAAAESREAARVAEERKKRNYADFWAPIPATEPFRVVLSHMRDRLYNTRQVCECIMCGTGGHIFTRGRYPAKPCLPRCFGTPSSSHPSQLLSGSLRFCTHHRHPTESAESTAAQLHSWSARESTLSQVTTVHQLGALYLPPSEGFFDPYRFRSRDGRRPLMPPGMDVHPDVKEVVATFRMLSELPHDSLGAYIISMAKTASDVLAVVLLQRETGVRPALRVVPLFETLDDLHNAPETMTTLLSNDWYRAHINGMHECMIGYSDSGKDAGRLAAAWALYETQEKLVAVAAKWGTRLVLFHGRGGTVGRGGGPTHMAIRSQPSGTINGHLRVTVQGEIIEQQFGEKEVCFRTLDLYTSAVLEAALDPSPAPRQEWRDLMTLLAADSCDMYRSIVYRTPEFYDYFMQSTAASELGRLNIGSRPSSRKQGGIETLRAIPWIFAWTQQRLHLPVWLGIGEALEKAAERGYQPVLQDMYANWPFFTSTLDLVEMVLAKADARLSAFYERTLVEPRLADLGERLRNLLSKTQSHILIVVRKSALLEGNTPSQMSTPNLDEKIRLRSPYVAPLNVLQALSLKGLRKFREQGHGEYNPSDPEIIDLLSRDPHKKGDGAQHPYVSAMDDCLMITIKGIAAGEWVIEGGAAAELGRRGERLKRGRGREDGSAEGKGTYGM
ncbi:hypothetical protein VOLCADRAFT_59445 [Volvox carteri f. nagariensis]|uniref:Phosphoenolpyruvate carboxylase n=1 Tax=Volvox carteri f. nagariensis TaxID=3068 RepID=D8TSR6_VOLCA|nr:uncharacterized protein VOLCADRAFT_59445 [Volvox carteri f. nagariensis]EFJ49534.1 hypothetical protein VOLCADRAFT_59445 [Volvox carteri f. nagariensis]|eukprot:XP_002949515.1 hypothetical protein VOLCADRAFT_59445 [Volvox carteri f. nagariensis]